MTYLLTLATLGNFFSYKTVVYRVYVPKDRRREPIRIATSFGPLAIIAANIVNTYNSNPEDRVFFHLVLFTPITLSTTLNNISPSLIKIRIKNLEALATRISKELHDHLKKDKSTLEKCPVGFREEAYTVTVESNLGKDDIKPRDQSGDLGKLPVTIDVNSKIIVEKVRGNTRIEADGKITIVLVPLTGSFTVCNKIILFREKRGKDAQIFSEIMLGSIIEGLRGTMRKIDYNPSEEENVLLLVDTSHGLNSVTSIMLQAVSNTLPLIRYTVKSKGFNDLETRFYNSDPVLQTRNGDSCKTLVASIDNNVSYYYTGISSSNLLTIVRTVGKLIKTRNESKDPIYDAIKGLVLLSYGLIPWGLYEISKYRMEEFSNKIHLARVSIDEGKTQTIEVKYELEREYRESPHLYVIGAWISELVVKAARNIEEHTTTIKCGAEARVKCYDIEYMKSLVEIDEKEDTGNQWYLQFIRETMDRVTSIIVGNEIKEWKENPYKRLTYIVSTQDESRDVEYIKENMENYCKDFPHNYSDENLCYICPTRKQENIRNIVAHAGLTSVIEEMAFVFEKIKADKDDKVKHRVKMICIGEKFPHNVLLKLIGERFP